MSCDQLLVFWLSVWHRTTPFGTPWRSLVGLFAGTPVWWVWGSCAAATFRLVGGMTTWMRWRPARWTASGAMGWFPMRRTIGLPLCRSPPALWSRPAIMFLRNIYGWWIEPCLDELLFGNLGLGDHIYLYRAVDLLINTLLWYLGKRCILPCLL